MTGSIARYFPLRQAQCRLFGDWRTEPTVGLTDIGYTDHRHNNLGSGATDIGLIYMNARYYLPGLGRFISADTIVPDPTNPQSYNRYGYVRNSPLKFTDPTGHRECEGVDPCKVALSEKFAPTPLNPPLENAYQLGAYDASHYGIDLGPAPNTSVSPSTTGTVIVADACGACPKPAEGICSICSEGDNFGAGNVVIVEYDCKRIPRGDRETWGLQPGDSVYMAYQHLSTISAEVGEQVTINDVIGTTGRTGNTSENVDGGGDHLHFEIRVGPPDFLSPTGDFTSINSTWKTLNPVDPTAVFHFGPPPWKEE